MIDEKKLIKRFKKLQGVDTLANMFIRDVIKEIKKQPKLGDWIPVSERLPENISTVIVQVKEIENPTFGWYGSMSGWKLTERDFAELDDFTVIAWTPLPEPYQPKQPEWIDGMMRKFLGKKE